MQESDLYSSEHSWLLSRSPPKRLEEDQESELVGMNEDPSPRKLKSSLGFSDVYSFTITILLNAIFINHAVLEIGSLVSALILFACAGLVTGCAVALYMELSTFLPSAGGDYEYIRVAFGNMSGFTYAWMMFFFLQSCTTAMQALTFSTHVSCKLFPQITEGSGVSPCERIEGHTVSNMKVKAVALGGIMLVVWLNFSTMKVVSRVQSYFALIKGAMVAFVFAISLRYAIQNPKVLTENVEANWNKTNIRSFDKIVTSLLWNVNGFNSVVCLSEEVVNPRKNLRGGLFYGMLTIFFAYLALVVSYYCVLDPNNLDYTTGTAAEVVRKTMGKHWESVFTVFVAISTLSSLNAGIATGGRWLYAVARNNQMPPFVARIGKRTNSPYGAVLMQGLWPAICLLFKGPSFDNLLAFFGQSSWLFYAMIACAYLQFQWTLHSKIWTRKRIITSVCAVVVFTSSLVMLSVSFYDSPFMTVFSLCFVLSSIPVYHLMEYLKFARL